MIVSALNYILFIVDNIPPTYGGLATSAQRIVNYLAESYNVIILTPSQAKKEKKNKKDKKPAKEVEWSHNVQIIHFKRPKNETKYLEEFSRMGEKLCEEIKFEAIIGFYLYRAGFIATYLGKRYEIPTVVSARGNDIHRSLFHSKRHSFVRYCLANCTRFTSVSTELKEKGHAFEEIAQKATVVGNGVDFEFYQKRDDKIKESEKLVIGFAGDDRSKKGFRILLKAISILPKSLFDHFELFIAGSFKEKDLKNNLLETAPRVVYTYFGVLPRESMRSFYQSLDLLVIPSINDGLPNVLLEGIASGTNIIGSKTGGIKDVLIDFPEKFFKSEDPEELAILLTNILQGKKDSAERNDELLKHCQTQYSQEAEKRRWKKAISMAINE